MKKIFIWGARRTGTNYTEALCMTNFTNPVANLNKSHNQEYRYFRSKHEMDMDVSEKFDPDSVHIVVVKNPISWVVSRNKYEAFCGQSNPNHVPKSLDSCIADEYNGFYDVLRISFSTP